ncbi:hypothetical protein chiPu_0033552, partial [Chiloscyllium punctatum]|nr:hypothetical protein [Chiloscyllium punctatum]
MRDSSVPGSRRDFTRYLCRACRVAWPAAPAALHGVVFDILL